jgi:hypothetical protein
MTPISLSLRITAQKNPQRAMLNLPSPKKKNDHFAGFFSVAVITAAVSIPDGSSAGNSSGGRRKACD